MTTLRGGGFTLLELVISCAIVVTIFALAATTLTRVQRLRADSESQTRLMTEGRALLDDLADQLAHAAGTNIWISENNSGDNDGKLTLALIRYAVHSHSLKTETHMTTRRTTPCALTSLRARRAIRRPQWSESREAASPATSSCTPT